MGKVGLVCDSTCDLDPTWLVERDVVMVPLKVQFGEETYLDWVDLAPKDFYAKMDAAPALPTTSQPSPAEFSAVYARLASEGCTDIVVVVISEALSGTHESAMLGAADSPVPVRVVNTASVSAGEALAVDAAIAARDAGGDAEAIEAAARDAVLSMRLLFALDTLDNLVKGGRAGKAVGLAASLLNIKPVLTFSKEGTIEPFKKVKGIRKAIGEMASQAVADAGGGRVRVALLHSMAEDLVHELRYALDAAGLDYELAHVIGVGAVIGTHAGRGAVGLAYHLVP